MNRLLLGALLLGLNTGLTLVLLLAGFLRETPIFWRNAGGFPELLRAAVKFAFLPFFGADVLLVVATCLMILRHRRAEPGIARFGLILVAVQLVLLTLIVILVMSNNLDNLLNGRPWHWKPQ